MFVNVADMQLGKVRLSETFAPGAIEFFDPQLRQAAPLVFSGVAELSQATLEIRLSGHLSTSMEVACDRCLEPVSFPLEADFSLLYWPVSAGPAQPELAIAGEETEVGFYEGEGLDLRDVLREQVLLLLPMQRVCRADCQGICPVCGRNRNEAACDCRQEMADDRWAGLRNLQRLNSLQ